MVLKNYIHNRKKSKSSLLSFMIYDKVKIRNKNWFVLSKLNIKGEKKCLGLIFSEEKQQ